MKKPATLYLPLTRILHFILKNPIIQTDKKSAKIKKSSKIFKFSLRNAQLDLILGVYSIEKHDIKYLKSPCTDSIYLSNSLSLF